MYKIIITRAMCFKQPDGNLIELIEICEPERDTYTVQRFCDFHLLEAYGQRDKKSATKNFDLWVKFEKKIGSKQL